MFPHTWREVVLDDICESITVGHVGSMASEYTDKGVPFLRSQNVEPFRLDLTNLKFVSQEFHAKLAKSALEPGDVVVVRTGYPGTACVIPPGLLSSNCSDLVIVKVGKQALPDYLVALFNSSWGRRSIQGRLVGVAQQHFNVSAAKKMRIRLPPLEQQERVSWILRGFNDLIENNRRRIQILEEMARPIYREWFVRFRFPGHEEVEMVDSETGQIPEGWTETTVENAFEITGGGTPSTKNPEFWEEGIINWYTPSDLTSSKSMFMDESGKKITELGLRRSSARMFPARSVMMTSRATIGFVSINTTPACTNQGFITCIPNERVSECHIYFWLLDNVERFLSLGTGTTYKEIIKSVFRTIEFLLPPVELMRKYTELVNPMCELILNLLRLNRNLTASRDSLLPKLVSGQLDVSGFDIGTLDSNQETSKYKGRSTL